MFCARCSHRNILAPSSHLHKQKFIKRFVSNIKADIITTPLSLEREMHEQLRWKRYKLLHISYAELLCAARCQNLDIGPNFFCFGYERGKWTCIYVVPF